MRVLSRILLALAILLPCSLVATPAHAEDKTPSSWKVTEYTATATPDKDGNVRVVLDLAFDFAGDAGHGPILAFTQRMRVQDNPDVWRETPVTVDRVESPTGANTNTQRDTKDQLLLVKVGQQGTKYTGVQRYRITYTLRGVTQPNNATSGLDELNWMAVGNGWQVPVRKATIMVDGLAAPTKTACFTGKNFDKPCEHRVEGNRATFTAENLGTEVGVQTVAGYPVGTFTEAAQPTFSKRSHFGNMFPLTPVSGGLAALVAAVGSALVLLRVRRHGRDEVYAGLTPGLTPTGDAEGQTVRQSGRTRFAVQFTPPAGAKPGELGTLIDERADDRDVTATIIDLAIRGHLRIEETGNKEWTLVKLLCPEQVEPYERAILDTLFTHHETVSTQQLKDKEFAGLMTDTKASLYERVHKHHHWFSGNPEKVRGLWVVAGLVLAGLGVAIGVGLGLVAGLGLVGAGIVVVGLLLAAMSGRMPARTAEGSAVLAQTKGFEQYLSTAEGDQIRFEEGVDVFSRYLPYAIVFGVAERWAKVFSDLAAQGRYEPESHWYVSPHGYGFYYGAGFASSLDGLSTAMASSISEAVSSVQASSSSSSGFSGGGGFGGGGGGGW
ncbi:hypothetical protein CGZ93_01360 [Enemella dayhoffiae]|uniref:DUF2207 domain-containing protein n=1 Tax=Enemella dayhoffiae TaxID=2016507 RepID=A0A255HDM4_9ACTN|nr:DUF2207 domain-containing protein [Enemella dayhoffiae]OYO25133.1 hypothetical protein CGZ93_01360 [Enemella dayhoffiae]